MMKFLILILTLQCFTNILARTIRSEKDIEEYREFLKKSVNGKPEESTNSEPAWLRSGKFEGDMVLSEEQIDSLVDVYTGARNALVNQTKLWPYKLIIYEIELSYFNPEQVLTIERAIADIVSKSCLVFKERNPADKDYIKIEGVPGGCWSEVGYLANGGQVLNLEPNSPGNGCFRHGSIVHELLHAIGFYHMQSTHNRDDFVQIVWDKIIPGLEHNFEKYTKEEVSNLETIYDYGSVMHYPEVAFSIDGSKTIIPTQPTDEELGQKVGMSETDIIKLNRLYNCPGF